MLCLLVLLLLYPYRITINGANIVDPYIKKRLASVGILFLVLRGFIHDYYLSLWAILFLCALILSSTLPFGLIVLLTLGGLIILKSLKKI